MIKDLEEQLRIYAQKIANLETEILKLKGRVTEAPKVHRVADIEKVNVVYQPDPNVIERNKDLSEEIDYLTVLKHHIFILFNPFLAPKPET